MVFVTDGLLRKSVVVCQSLGRRGLPVAVGSTTRLSPAFFSRYCRGRLVHPAPDRDPDGYVESLLGYLRRHRHDVLIPTDDASLRAIMPYREDFERVTHIPLPAAERVQVGLDKSRAMRLAAELGMPHPRTAFPQSPAGAQGAAVELGGPVVVKPRASSGGRGIAYPDDAGAVAAAWQATHEAHPFPLIQERLPNGTRYDVCVLVDGRGEAVASFVQKELRHFPVRDGMSTLQESVWRPELVERTVRLLRAIGWYGLAEVEYMVHPQTGEAMLMEINPRFWASIRLAIACGVDFPYLLYRVARGQAVTPVHTYAVGRRCRWLLPGDLLHFLTNPDRLRLEPSFFHFGRETVYDGIDGQDAGATLGVVLSTAHYLLDGDLWGLLWRGRRQPARRPAEQTMPVASRPVPGAVAATIGG